MRLFTNQNKALDLEQIEHVVVDIDNTLWRQPDEADAEELEFQIFAEFLGTSGCQLQEFVQRQKIEWREQRGRKFSMYEILQVMGVENGVMSLIRCSLYQPERFITHANRALSFNVRKLSQSYGLVFATNSPAPIGLKILKLLGIAKALKGKAKAWGSENLNGLFKPNPDFFSLIAENMGWDRSRCLSIGDSKHKDGYAALQAGFAAAIIIDDHDDLYKIIPVLIYRNTERRLGLCSQEQFIVH